MNKRFLPAAAPLAIPIASVEWSDDDSNSNWYSDAYGYGCCDATGRGRGSGDFTMDFTGKADKDKEWEGDAHGSGDGRGDWSNYNDDYHGLWGYNRYQAPWGRPWPGYWSYRPPAMPP